MYYIFNADGNLVGTSDYEPNLEDLQTRNEYFTESNHELIFNKVVGGKYGGIYEIVETPEDVTQQQQQTPKIVSQRNKFLTKFSNGSIFLKPVICLIFSIQIAFISNLLSIISLSVNFLSEFSFR